ncbi:MAG: hypothetical protein AAF065_05275 [Verrucomicrobiota bacterium]
MHSRTLNKFSSSFFALFLILIAGCTTEEIAAPSHYIDATALGIVGNAANISLIPASFEQGIFPSYADLYKRIDSAIVNFFQIQGLEIDYVDEVLPNTAWLAEKTARSRAGGISYTIKYTPTPETFRKIDLNGYEYSLTTWITITDVKLKAPYSSHTWAGVRRRVLHDGPGQAGWGSNNTMTLFVSMQAVETGKEVYSSRAGLTLAMKSSIKTRSLDVTATIDPIESQDVKDSEIQEAVQIALQPLVNVLIDSPLN